MEFRYDGVNDLNIERQEFTGSVEIQTVVMITPSAYVKFTSDAIIQDSGFTFYWHCTFIYLFYYCISFYFFSFIFTFYLVAEVGCDGVFDSGSVVDSCGICGGTNDCIGCDGVAHSNKTYLFDILLILTIL